MTTRKDVFLRLETGGATGDILPMPLSRSGRVIYIEGWGNWTWFGNTGEGLFRGRGYRGKMRVLA